MTTRSLILACLIAILTVMTAVAGRWYYEEQRDRQMWNDLAAAARQSAQQQNVR